MLDRSAQVTPVAQGIPWLGFVVFPDHRRVKSRKVTAARRRLGHRFEAWREGRISFAEFDASVKGWVNHVRYADTWRLREQILQPFVQVTKDCRGVRGTPPPLRGGGQ